MIIILYAFDFLIRNPGNKASSSVLKKLKLQFRNKIALPVFTGMPLLGENRSPIEIVMIDGLTGQIVKTGDESAAKLEIMGFRVGDHHDADGCGGASSWTYEDFQERVMSERKGRRILQGNTRLQLKEGVGFVHKISFTHNSEHTRNGLYRLVAVVVDAAWMNKVEVALTETFVMKDQRCTCKYSDTNLSYKQKFGFFLLTFVQCKGFDVSVFVTVQIMKNAHARLCQIRCIVCSRSVIMVLAINV